MGEISNALHGCAAKYAEDAEADGKADWLTRGKNGVDGRIGESKRRPDQHGADGNDGKVENQNAHVDARRIYQAVWSNRDKVGQDTSGPDRGGG